MEIKARESQRIMENRSTAMLKPMELVSSSSSGSDSQSKVGKIKLKRKKHVVLDKPVKKQKPGELGLLPSRVVAADSFRLRKQGTSVFRTLQEKS